MTRRPLLAWLRRKLAWDRTMPVWYAAEYRLPLTAFGKRTGLEPRRADLVAWYLLEHGWIARDQMRAPVRASYEALARVHDAEYLESLGDRATLGRIFGVDAWDVPVGGVLDSVRLATGGTIAATEAALVRGGPALNLLGGFHHAGPDFGTGLCAVNDIAVALASVRAQGFSGSVAVIDLDAHPPDGTAACLEAEAPWIGSLSGRSSGPVHGVDERVLPPGCGDEQYLVALDELLGGMPEAVLTFVVAGGDVLAHDHMGQMALTLRGVRERDLRVARAVAGRASVWLPGGGYHDDAWQVLAGTAIVLGHRARHQITPGDDPLSARFARLARHMDVKPRHRHDDETAEIEAELGIRARPTPRLLLDVYTVERLEFALYRYGVLPFLERRGYSHFRIELTKAASGGERIVVHGRADNIEQRLIDCVLERQDLDGLDALYVHWLELRDPQARFSPTRPQLPGQEVPGLGLAREIGELLWLMSQRIGTLGLAFRPAWYHLAYAVRHRFRFLDVDRQGQFEAMVRDLADVPLDTASRLVAAGRVHMNGTPLTWEAALMVSWPIESPADRAAGRRCAGSDPMHGRRCTGDGHSDVNSACNRFVPASGRSRHGYTTRSFARRDVPHACSGHARSRSVSLSDGPRMGHADLA